MTGRLVREAAWIARRRLVLAWRRRRDRRLPSFALGPGPALARHLARVPLDLLQPRRARVAALAHATLEHRFDLLGSGPVQVRHGASCRGLAGHRFAPGPAVAADREGRWLEGRIGGPNLAEARRRWSCVDEGYAPIDWQLDFRSGYRWSEGTWYRDIAYGREPGADVKLPWELARMQHLPGLAWAYALAAAGEPGFAPPEVYAREFRNQVLDFTATNPPRFGVNWACTMDVAIRVAGWVVAYDLFRAHGASFDGAFRGILGRAVQEHARHVAGNLEWSARLRANHYLAGVAGLLVAAAYLPGAVAGRWLGFARRELVRETARQFFADGGNFEASTSYHRLSAETVLYGTALATAATGTPLPAAHLEALDRIARFSAAVTRPDGRAVQVGDNDSGRFLKLWPAWGEGDGTGLEEDPLDHRHLLAAFLGVWDRPDLAERAGGPTPETALVRGLLGGRALPGAAGGDEAPPALRSFPGFGLHVYRTARVYLAVRCGPVGQEGHGGHAHNDQLSFELCLDGVAVIVDPGTYVYTPLPAERNRFRSTAMHGTLQVADREQDGWVEGPAGLFALADTSHARAIEVTPGRFAGEHRGFGPVHRRTIEVGARGIEVADVCDSAEPKALRLHLAPGVEAGAAGDGAGVVLVAGTLRVRVSSDGGEWSCEDGRYSPGYGIVVASRVAVLRTTAPSVRWRVAVEGA